MRTHARLLIAAVALLGAVPAAAQPPSGQPVPTSSPFSTYPLDVQLGTVVDHPAELAGLLVRLTTARVTRVVSGTLVELKDAREYGQYHFHVFYKPDDLLAVLPAGARISKGDEIVVTGTLRTMLGAAVSQEAPAAADTIKHYGNRPVLIVRTATTADGASLVNSR